MDDYLTLHEFMLHTKAVLYILVVTILAGYVGFWAFLTERDEDDEYEPPEEHDEKH